MKTRLFIPKSICQATRALGGVNGLPLQSVPKDEFMKAWCSLVYLLPGLHADRYFEPGNGLTRKVNAMLAEVWRRADEGQMTDDELYPYEVIKARLA